MGGHVFTHTPVVVKQELGHSEVQKEDDINKNIFRVNSLLVTRPSLGCKIVPP